MSRRIRSRRRSEEHTSELQSQSNLVCRLLLEKKNNSLHAAGLETSLAWRGNACAHLRPARAADRWPSGWRCPDRAAGSTFCVSCSSPLRNTTRRSFLPRGTPEVKPSMSQCGRIAAEAGQTVAGKCFSCQRKVRAPQSRVLGNAQAPRGDEEDHRDES